MPKPKLILESGDVLKVDDAKIEQEPIQITYTQAKKLVKKEMTEKQKANVERLIALNRKKWEDKKQLLEQKKAEEQKKRLADEEETKTTVIVKPKRIYKPRLSQTKANEDDEEEDYDDTIDMPNEKPKLIRQKGQLKHRKVDSESEESDEDEYQLKKVKKKVEKKEQLLKKINQVIEEAKQKPSYLDKLNVIWN